MRIFHLLDRGLQCQCLPEGRIWPQKCDRCLQHRPEALGCSEPELNNRKRGKNAPKRSTKTRSTPDVQDSAGGKVSRAAESVHGDGDESLSDAPQVKLLDIPYVMRPSLDPTFLVA